MIDFGILAALLLAALLLFTLAKSFVIVPQSENYVVERLGRYSRTLKAGVHILVPFVESVRQKVSVIERQLSNLNQDAITTDNVVIQCVIAVFFRVQYPERTVYRIKNIEGAVSTTVAGIVRSEIGRIDLDAVQSNRAALNSAIKDQLADATADWGITVTRAEVLDVNLDAGTREAMMQQLNAERARRASVTQAEGLKRSIELKADATLYEAKKVAEARRITAEADAFATATVAKAISEHGTEALEFEIRKRQVETMAKLGKGENSRLIMLPTELADAFGDAAKLFKKG